MTDIEGITRQYNTHDWTPEHGRTAVLLIDLQEYFREIIHPILDNIVRVISASREKQIPLVFTQHGHEPGADHGMLGRWWTDLIFEGSDDARLIPELKVRTGDLIIPKNTYSSFHNTGLEETLRHLEVTDLVIGGVMTNLCCETTAREAFVRDYCVFFLADGTSTVSGDFHLASLKNLAYGFATLWSCDQLIRWLKSEGKSSENKK